MLGPHPAMVKSRVGVESQPLKCSKLPYLVRGVGIGIFNKPEMSCGEIIISYYPREKICPAFCRIFIQ